MASKHKLIAVTLLKNIVARYFDCSFGQVVIESDTLSNEVRDHDHWLGLACSESLALISDEFFYSQGAEDAYTPDDIVFTVTNGGDGLYHVWMNSVSPEPQPKPFSEVWAACLASDEADLSIACHNFSELQDLNEFGQTPTEEALEYRDEADSTPYIYRGTESPAISSVTVNEEAANLAAALHETRKAKHLAFILGLDCIGDEAETKQREGMFDIYTRFLRSFSEWDVLDFEKWYYTKLNQHLVRPNSLI